MDLSKTQHLSLQDLQTLKRIEFDILREVILVIERLGLSYYAVGGTALGAFKYRSFIPWDDDIDIAMPRKDFLEFIKKAPELLPNYLRIDSLYTNKNYTLGVMKVRDERTTFFDIYTAQYDVSHGVFIDIFPIDICGKKNPNNSLLFKMRNNKISWSCFYKPDNASFKNKLISFICKLLLVFENPHKCALKNDKYLAKLAKKKKSETVFMRTEVHKILFFDGYGLLKFGDLNIRVPNQIEEYLRNCYGDISKNPPKNKMIPHHFVLKFDPHNSYTKYRFEKGEVL